ncbi:MAG: D-sedoheptulose 7-phosphate isomerase [Ignavibacteria bacterium]|nr:D-sedoheptulose 7-phosphate isomerase [Ignavibacteria bacterium]
MAHRPLTLVYRQKFVIDSLNESAQIKRRIADQCVPQVIKAIDLIIDAFNKKKKILLCGNGGSAADAQHLATEFVIRLSPKIQRPGLPAIALTTDSSTLTAGANDLGFENVFARSVEALGEAGDVLIGLSTSGNSESVNRAFQKAKEKKMTTIGLLGNDGGRSKDLVDLAIIVPSCDTQRIQEGHITIGHIIFQEVEQEMFGQVVPEAPPASRA